MPRIEYRCQRIETELRIDGILNEKEWQKAECLEFFIPVTLQRPISQTRAKLLYDHQYLYIGFMCFDKDIIATHIKRDSPTWEEDVAEIFIMPSMEKKTYYELEFSPIKTIFDAFIPDPDYSKNVLDYSGWNCEGLLIESFIFGTINDSSDSDNYWSIEIAIPFKSLPTLENIPPEKGTKWLFHLARYDYSCFLKNYRELSSCARLTERNFHKFEEWLVLIFD
ncbi:MAG: carbohydrate-binding family 9-like protein [bacterium]|nr:carbohydrate-binding family 9-like protein [bacterium]